MYVFQHPPKNRQIKNIVFFLSRMDPSTRDLVSKYHTGFVFSYSYGPIEFLTIPPRYGGLKSHVKKNTYPKEVNTSPKPPISRSARKCSLYFFILTTRVFSYTFHFENSNLLTKKITSIFYNLEILIHSRSTHFPLFFQTHSASIQPLKALSCPGWAGRL